jgi:alanine racemase
MDQLSANTFGEIVSGTAVAGNLAQGIVVQHVSTHSRRIHSGSAFFALSGHHADGHRFAAEALENGAAVVVARAGSVGAEVSSTGHLIEVDDPLKALQRLARWWRAQIEGKVVGVVGSNGKTITKDALAHLLAEQISVYASPGSYNSQLGVPLAVLACPRRCDVAVFELAVSEPGEMAELQRVVRPDCVVMTNLGARWRSRFRDRDHQAREMLSICTDLDADQWLLIGQLDEEISRVAAEISPCRKYTRGDRSMLPVMNEPRYEREGLTVETHFPDGRSGRVNVQTPSEEILADVELAIDAAWLLGVESTALLSAAHAYKPTSTRMEMWRSPTGTTLIRDIATPDPIAVGSAIRAAKRVAGGAGRTVVVLGDQLELVDSATVEALAQALSDERVDGVYGSLSGLSIALRKAIDALANPVPMRTFETVTELRAVLLDELGPGDVALVQSPASAPIGDFAAGLVESMAPTRLYLDLSAIEENVSTFRRLVGPSVRLMGMVKALAYGTDGSHVASCLEASGVDCLGVSSADEGIALRRAGITLPIVIMLGTGLDLEKLLRHQLTPLLYSAEMLDAVVAMAPEAQERVTVHVKIDSGMHRTGFPSGQARQVLTRLRDADNVYVEGIMTHFACADDPADDEFTARQVAVFSEVLDAARELGLRDIVCHAASTAATIRLPETHLDMVRLGIGLYGIHPSAATRARVDLVPAFGLVSRIVEILDLVEGERIGYGGTYRVPPGGARVGVVPAGYHDCVPRGFSNVGHVIVAGTECSIVGRVSMDSMTVDLSQCEDVHVGSDVLILGRYGDWVVEPERLAESIGTIAYELMVRVGPRVQRILTRH